MDKYNGTAVFDLGDNEKDIWPHSEVRVPSLCHRGKATKVFRLVFRLEILMQREKKKALYLQHTPQLRPYSMTERGFGHMVTKRLKLNYRAENGDETLITTKKTKKKTFIFRENLSAPVLRNLSKTLYL